MNYKYLVIIIFITLVGVITYRCSNDCGACSGDEIHFQDWYNSSSTMDRAVKKLDSFSMQIDTGCAVKLSNVLIEITLPKEVVISPFFRPQPNEHFDYVNNKVSRKIDKILQISSEMLGVSVKYDSTKWSKPIEVFISFDYKRTVDCPYPAYIDGRYTKKRYLLYNEEGKLYDTSYSDDKTWTYVGPSR